jgi:transposase-like protein
LVVSDKCLWLVEALGECFPETRWQRCVVHFYRNVFRLVPTGKVKEVAELLKAIHAQEDREAASAKAAQVVAKLEGLRLGKAACLVREGVAATLAYMGFSRQHWTRLRTNNPLKRLNRETRRRTRVEGVSPNGESALVLVAARLRHMAGTKWGTRRYLNMGKLPAEEAGQEAVA